jgi:predicted GNAT family N-acyltransferase
MATRAKKATRAPDALAPTVRAMGHADELATLKTFPEVEVRVATTEAEREAIYRLRHEVYVRELGEYEDAAQDGMLRDPSDDRARHLYVRIHDTVVGALRYHLGKDGPFSAEDERIYDLPRFRGAVRDDQMAVLSRFCALPEYRPLLVPFKLLVQSLPLGPDGRPDGEAGRGSPYPSGVELLFCDCQPHLVNLYARLGFRSFTRVYSDPVASILVPLVLVRGDVAHFRRLGSPVGERDPGPDSIALAARVLPLLRGGAMQRVDGRERSWDEIFFALQDLPGGRASLFDGLVGEEVQAVLAQSFQLELQPGDRLLRRGQLTRTLFVVVLGHLEVREADAHVATLERGDVFGEVAFLLPDQRRISDVFAMDEGTLVVGMSESSLWQLVESSPRASALLLRNLARGLAQKLVERSERAAGPIA